MSDFVNKKIRFWLTILIVFALGTAAGTLVEEGISKDLIASAEKLFALEFTDAERDSMIENLTEQRSYFSQIHQYELKNSDHFPLIFNPVPEGFQPKHLSGGVNCSDYSNTIMPADINDLAFYSIGELSHLIKSRKITSLELTKFYIQRLKDYGYKLQAVISITEDLALKQAALADAEIVSGKYRGILHGIPYGVKDLFAEKDYKTTWGSVIYKDQILDYDADVVKKLTEAGAVLTAKLTMGELAWGDVWYGGMTRTPWDTSRGSSGSSAGSASTVAAGLLPFAIGTETWGSIVSPSTVCGVTGLRPTFGRVSRAGAMALSWSMDKAGPICRNAEDCIIVLNAIAGVSKNDPYTRNFPLHYQSGTDITRLKVGYLKDEFEGEYPFAKNDSDILRLIRENGFNPEAVALPSGYPLYALSIILSAESAALFDEVTRTNQDDKMVRQIKNAWPNSFRSSRFIPAVEYINANRIRWKLCNELNELFKNYDLIIVPSWQGNNLFMTNLTGHPSITIPTGFASPGVPSSITFLGGLYDEGTIAAFANFIQKRTGFHKEIPPFVKR